MGAVGASSGDARQLNRALLARLGLAEDATEGQVVAAYEAIAASLRDVPAPARAWARKQQQAAQAALVLLTGAEQDFDLGDAEPSEPVAVEQPVKAKPAATIAKPVVAQVSTDGVRSTTNADLTDEEFAALERGEPVATARVSKPSRAARAGRGKLPVAHRRHRPSRAVGLTLIILAVTGVLVGVYFFGDSKAVPGIGDDAAAASSQLDTAAVGDLMKKLQTNPKDPATLRALGDQYFQAGDYSTAVMWLLKAVDAKPKDADIRLALGAAYFNGGKSDDAEKQWLEVIRLNPKLAEAHYDLGFLYLSKTPPDMAKVRAEWNKVIQIDPNSDIAKNVATHMKSMDSNSASPAPAK